MKKFFFLFALLVVSNVAQAQIVSSRSQSTIVLEQPEPVSEKFSFWYMRAGVNIAGATGDTQELVGEDGASFRGAYDFSFGFEREISHGLYWGMDFALGSRGYNYSYSGSDYNLFAHNMRWNLFNFGWNHSFSNTIALDIHTGVFMSIDYAGRLDFGNSTVSIWDYNDTYTSEYMPLNVGMQFGVGIWLWNHMNIDLTFQPGFLPMESLETYGDEYSIQSFDVMIRLGYRF